MNSRSYHSPLRGAQAAATRERILEAVGTLLDKGQEPTFALIASEAGCEQRTVYRHFPNKDELAAAFWTWQARLLGPEEGEPSTEDELLARVQAAFVGFDAHERHIRAMLHTEHGRAARLSDNERRHATFLRVLDDAVPGLDPAAPPARGRHAAAAPLGGIVGEPPRLLGARGRRRGGRGPASDRRHARGPAPRSLICHSTT